MNHIVPATLPRIVVIGGGFSGTAFVLHLLRDAPELRAAITVVEPRARLAEGLAYSTQSSEHRINVAAARMTMFAEAPTDFDDWFYDSGCAATDPDALVLEVGAYPARKDFAAYVRDRMAAALTGARGVRFRHVVARAEAAAPRGSGFAVTLSGGECLDADVLVLATGHPATEPPAPLRALQGDPGLIADPWSPERIQQIDATARVTIVGTGLTMADVLATLRAGGHRGPVVAVSRRGLLPRPRTRLPVTPTGRFDEPASETASALLHRVRQAIAAGAADGKPWEDTFDAVRAQGRAIWAALSPADRRRMLRHVGPFWDVHRYQCSPQIDALLRAELAGGGLRVVAASVVGAERVNGYVKLHVRPRGAPDDARRTLISEHVITCTGPGHRTAIGRNPVLQTLARAGLIQPDAYGLGIAVDAQARAIGGGGAAHPGLLVVGPPARGTWGELMGLPQVSAQPREIAAAVARRLTASLPSEQELSA